MLNKDDSRELWDQIERTENALGFFGLGLMSGLIFGIIIGVWI